MATTDNKYVQWVTIMKKKIDNANTELIISHVDTFGSTCLKVGVGA